MDLAFDALPCQEEGRERNRYLKAMFADLVRASAAAACYVITA